MAERIGIPEWRRQNVYTCYPFSERSTFLSLSNQVFPSDLLIDAVLYPLGSNGPLHVSVVRIESDQVELIVGSGSNRFVASAKISLLGSTQECQVFDPYGRPAGMLLVRREKLGHLTAWGVGEHFMSERSAEFCPVVCLPLPERGVFGIVTDDNPSAAAGDVWLVGGDGVVLTVDDVLHPDADSSGGNMATHHRIKVHVVGDPLFRRRMCADLGEDWFSTPRFIKVIRVVGPNGSFECRPGESGNFILMANNSLAQDTILRIETEGSTIRIYVASVDE